jgi:hypothetical protein
MLYIGHLLSGPRHRWTSHRWSSSLYTPHLQASQHRSSSLHTPHHRTSQSWKSSIFTLHCQNSQKTLSGKAKAAYSCLLEEFPAVVCSSKWLPTVSHDTVHHIVTGKQDSKKLAVAKAQQFKQLEEDGIIQQSTSPWSSWLHMVNKADASSTW